MAILMMISILRVITILLVVRMMIRIFELMVMRHLIISCQRSWCSYDLNKGISDTHNDNDRR